MDTPLDQAIQTLTTHLRDRGKATNRELIDLLGGDHDLFDRAREAVIFDEVADDRRGVGLVYRTPDPAAPSSITQPQPAAPRAQAQRLRIFLSYGHDEYAPLAEKLLRDLQQRGHEVWFDRNVVRAGVVWESRIESGLQWVAATPGRGFVVLLMTPHSVRRPNGYCLAEVAYALNQHVPIVPVMLVDVVPPLSIAAIQWLDLRDCVPIEGREACYVRRLPALITALEHNSLDFEGAQARVFKALRPVSCAQDVEYHLPRFTGRQWLFRRIDEWLADPHGSQVFWITGGPGSGKSAIAAWLSMRRSDSVAFHVCKASNSLKIDPTQVVRSLSWQLSTQIPDHLNRLLAIPNLEESCEKADAATLFDLLIVQPLYRLPAPAQAVFMLIDGLDEATRAGRNEVARFLADEAARLPAWMRVILTSRPEIEVTQYLQMFDPVVLTADSAENDADIHAYLQTQIAPFAPSGALPVTMQDALLVVSEHNWLYLEWVRQELQSGRLSLTQIDGFPKGLGGVYRQFFERRFPDTATYVGQARPVLELVIAACEPPLVTELARFLGTTIYAVNDVLRMFGSLLESFDGRVRLFHSSLSDWLVDAVRAGDYLVDPRAGHRTLADVGWTEYRCGIEIMSEYMKRWLPTHLEVADRKDELDVCVTDAAFIRGIPGGRHLDLARFWHDAAAPTFVARCQASYDRCVQAGEPAEQLFVAARGLGQLFQHCGIYDRAASYFERALVHATALGEAVAIGFAHLDIGWCWRHAESFDRAVAHVDQALECFQASQNDGAAGLAESIKGICLWHLQQDEAALAHLERARTLCANAGDQRGEAEALNHLGIVLRSLGQYERSLECLHNTERFFAGIKDLRGLGKIYNSLGTAYWWTKQHDRAFDYYRKADDINARTHQRYITGLTANNLGYLYLEVGQARQAYDSFLRARAIHQQLHTGGYERMYLAGLALASHALGDAAAARKLSQEALDGLSPHQPVEDMLRAYYNRWYILKDGDAADVIAAGAALTTARRLVGERLARIADPRLHADFIARVPLIRELQS